MSSFVLGDVRDYTACMRICEPMIEQDPRQEVEVSSMPIESITGAVWKLQHPVWRSMRSHFEEIHGISNSIPLIWSWHQHEEATSSCQWLTSLLWSGGDNSMPGKQLNPQHPVPQQQDNNYIIVDRTDGANGTPNSVHTGLIKAIWSKHPGELSISKTPQELKEQLQSCHRAIQLQE